VPIVPLYGHAAVLDRLAGAFRRGSLPASLLLQGPAGIGKQRLAVELGRLILCTGSQSGTPCGECQHCRFSGELKHPDLYWFFPRARPKDSDQDAQAVLRDYSEAIASRVAAGGLYAPPDPAHGIFVSTVRAILHAAQLSPAVGHRKVFVVGDAERMVVQEGTDQAANAFLKLLEEPPANTTLLLTSSEPGALLPTIRSRLVCIRVPALRDHEIRKFLGDPLVREQAKEFELSSREDDNVQLAAGAPGRLLAGSAPAEAATVASGLLDAAISPRRSHLYRTAFAQGVSGARGQYSVVLEALTAALHDRARFALNRGDEESAYRASMGVQAVEQARQRAFGNVSPQLVTIELLLALRSILAR
jgi:DNA polymerase-3 subunit delta'